MKIEFIHFDNLNSSNEYAKTIEFDTSMARVIVAGTQSEGKGREGRKFVSGRGGLYFSIVIDEEAAPADIPLVTQLAAAAVYKALKHFNIDVSVKWPNDIILNRKKLAGILTESISKGLRMRIIAGIGINLSNEVRNIEDATSLKNEGFSLERKDLLDKIIEHFFDSYSKLKTGDREEILNIVRENSYILNKKILVSKKEYNLPALAVDISPDGALIVEYEGGKSEIIRSGDVRIRLKEDTTS